MPTESSLKKSGKWNSWIQRNVNTMRKELIAQLGEEPKGRNKILLESILQKFGVLLVMKRQLQGGELVRGDGSLIPLLSKNHLAFDASLARSLSQLFGDGERGSLPTAMPDAIDPRFKSKKVDA